LRRSKRPEDIDIVAEYNNLDESLFEELILLYLERCKYIHSMAFLQHWIAVQHVLTSSNTFNEKRDYLAKVLVKI
jgi:hypothetical protein